MDEICIFDDETIIATGELANKLVNSKHWEIIKKECRPEYFTVVRILEDTENQLAVHIQSVESTFRAAYSFISPDHVIVYFYKLKSNKFPEWKYVIH